MRWHWCIGSSKPLIMRAMQRLGKDDVNVLGGFSSWSAASETRWPRGSFPEGMQAYKVRHVFSAQQQIGQFGRLTPGQVQRFRADLDRLPAIRPIMQFGLVERFEFLDAVCYTANYGVPKGFLDESPAITEILGKFAQAVEASVSGPAGRDIV